MVMEPARPVGGWVDSYRVEARGEAAQLLVCCCCSTTWLLLPDLVCCPSRYVWPRGAYSLRTYRILDVDNTTFFFIKLFMKKII